MCWWWFSSSTVLPGLPACAGTQPVPASGVLLQLCCCWRLPPAGSCVQLLCQDPASCLCGNALVGSALKDCFKPKFTLFPPSPRQNPPKPKQPKKSHHSFTRFSCLPFWTRWASFYREKEVLTAVFMKSRHHIALKKTEIFLQWQEKLQLLGVMLCHEFKVHFQKDELGFIWFFCCLFLFDFASSAIQPGDASLSSEWDSRNAPDTAPQHCHHIAGVAVFLLITLFYFMGSEHIAESRPIQNCLIVWNFSRHLLVGNNSHGCISFWGLSLKTSFPGEAFCSISNQPESNECNWLLLRDKMNKLIRFIISYNKCVYLPGSFQHRTSLKWKKGRGERGVQRVENSGKRSELWARLHCVTYDTVQDLAAALWNPGLLQ